MKSERRIAVENREATLKTLKHMAIALWSAVYNCDEKSMLLCAGKDYTKKYKFYVDRPGKVIKL